MATPSKLSQAELLSTLVAVATPSQFGSRANTTRTDTGVGGGGKLACGKFRQDFERAPSHGLTSCRTTKTVSLRVAFEWTRGQQSA